jgi:uncharacterized membrane protein
MSKLTSVTGAIVTGVILALLITIGIEMGTAGIHFNEPGLARWAHILSGIMWIGLLYYFNFVQIPTMPSVPAELKPGVTKYIAPKALFWFRWSALVTVVLGLLVAEMSTGGYVAAALTLQDGLRTIGIGMWLGLIMAANVWFVIWPNQKKALGIVPAEDAAKARAASTAMMASRTNLILSIPMLYCMIAQAHIG